MGGLKTNVVPYTTSANQTIKVVRFDYSALLYSLLSDEELNKPENLLETNPPYNGTYGDVNQCDAHRKAYKHYITDSNTQQLMEIILFQDKTHTDIHGRLCLEPIMLTLARYKESVRYHPRAWRTLGYVTASKYLVEDRVQDYHNIVNIVLEPLKEAQRIPLLWDFSGTVKAIISPVLFIMCDNEGADHFCARYQTKGRISYLCRQCNIPVEQTDDAFHKVRKWTKAKRIKFLSEQGRADYLKTHYSCHCVKNAFHDLMFSDYDGGVNQSTPAESLHTIDQGLHMYTGEALFGMRKQKK